MNKSIAAAVLCCFLISAPAVSAESAAPATGQAEAAVATLTSVELADRLRRKDFFLVNVHIPYEGEIADTDALVAYDRIADNLDKLPQDKNAPIILYCRSGRMSEIAARTLMDLGYGQVSHLAGGMIDWETSGYPILRK